MRFVGRDVTPSCAVLLVAFYSLEKLHRMQEGYRQCFRVAGRQLLLMEVNGHRYLLENRCPHAGHPLLESTVEGDWIRCPLHGICFHLLDGKTDSQEASMVGKQLSFFRIAYQDDQLGVDL